MIFSILPATRKCEGSCESFPIRYLQNYIIRVIGAYFSTRRCILNYRKRLRMYLLLLLCVLGLLAEGYSYKQVFKHKSLTRRNLRLQAGFGKPAPSVAKEAPVSDDQLCPCGSGNNYGDCCKSVHEFGMVTSSASDLIRARYSAYAMYNADFIIGTTSEQSPDFKHYFSLPGDRTKNLRRWSKDIHQSMMKDYFYIKSEIVEEEADSEQVDMATVTFLHLAIQKGSNVMYPVQEKATLVRDDGVTWKYVQGEVLRPASEDSSRMMKDWPGEMGLSLKTLEQQESDEIEREYQELDAARAAEEEGWVRDEDGVMKKEDPRLTAAAKAAKRAVMGRAQSNPIGGAFSKTLGRKAG